MAVVWKPVGFTEYNDPPNGAGNLRYGGYAFAELGTATRGGVATGTGNLARAFGYPGEVPMGTQFTFYANGRLIPARKEDRGYGQGGDGTHSDPAYAVDLYDGSAYGVLSLPHALALFGKGQVWVMWGLWHHGEALPRGAPQHLAEVQRPHLAPSVNNTGNPSDHARKTQHSGQVLGSHGSSFNAATAAMKTLTAKHIPLRITRRR